MSFKLYLYHKVTYKIDLNVMRACDTFQGHFKLCTFSKWGPSSVAELSYSGLKPSQSYELAPK